MSTAASEVSRSPDASTSSPRKPQSHKTLPPPKMRALISLYHQADSWITPENLLQKIDDAFVPQAHLYQSLALPAAEGITLYQLKDIQQATLAAPKMAQLEFDTAARQRPAGGLWSDKNKSKRERQVFEALYGVEVTSTNNGQQVLPGLEVLEEMEDSLTKSREEDKKSDGSNLAQ